MHQLRMSNVNSYVDTLNEIYTRLNFVKAILKSKIKESLIYVENLLKIAHLVIFKYLVNKESSCETTSTIS